MRNSLKKSNRGSVGVCPAVGWSGCTVTECTGKSQEGQHDQKGDSKRRQDS